MNKNERLKLAQWAMEYAQKQGADQVAASISNRRDIQIEYRDSKLEKLTESTQNGLSLDIYAKSRYSSHSTNDLRKDSLKKFISEAVAGTLYLTEDPYRSLPDPQNYPKGAARKLDLYDPAYTEVLSDKRVKIAAEIEKVARSGGDQIISATASYSDTFYEVARVHSNGFSGDYDGSMFSAGAEVSVRDDNGGRPSDWHWATTRFMNELPSPSEIGQTAAQRALSKIGQKKIESGKYPMLVENRAASRLIGMLYQPMTARALQQKRSYLDGMMGKKIASEKFTLIDNPFISKGLGSRFFDGEGLAAEKRVMIDKGVLKAYYIDNYYGKKLGLEPTTGSTSNLEFAYGSRPLGEIIKDIPRGILVTGFIGGNNNSTTGDFSYGIVGRLIENGELGQAVNEMNISGNAKDFWNQIAEVGNDVYVYSSWRRPSLLFEDVNFSGI